MNEDILNEDILKVMAAARKAADEAPEAIEGMSLKVTVRYRNLSTETHQAASMAQARRLVAAKQDFLGDDVSRRYRREGWRGNRRARRTALVAAREGRIMKWT
jgi:hypothetical protein